MGVDLILPPGPRSICRLLNRISHLSVAGQCRAGGWRDTGRREREREKEREGESEEREGEREKKRGGGESEERESLAEGKGA